MVVEVFPFKYLFSSCKDFDNLVYSCFAKTRIVLENIVLFQLQSVKKVEKVQRIHAKS